MAKPGKHRKPAYSFSASVDQMADRAFRVLGFEPGGSGIHQVLPLGPAGTFPRQYTRRIESLYRLARRTQHSPATGQGRDSLRTHS
jgi:hypothetical protein